jgi:flavin reductase (NADH)/flavin reductase
VQKAAFLEKSISKQFKNGMRCMASSVSIVATNYNGERRGLTATAVCSVTADPPRLLICINRGSTAWSAIDKSGAFTVNVLSGAQEKLAKAFADMIPEISREERFSIGEWDHMETGAPALKGALVTFDCRVEKAITESTHDIFIANVVAVRQNDEGAQLLYREGDFQIIR